MAEAGATAGPVCDAASPGEAGGSRGRGQGALRGVGLVSPRSLLKAGTLKITLDDHPQGRQGPPQSASRNTKMAEMRAFDTSKLIFTHTI